MASCCHDYCGHVLGVVGFRPKENACGGDGWQSVFSLMSVASVMSDASESVVCVSVESRTGRKVKHEGPLPLRAAMPGNEELLLRWGSLSQSSIEAEMLETRGLHELILKILSHLSRQYKTDRWNAEKPSATLDQCISQPPACPPYRRVDLQIGPSLGKIERKTSGGAPIMTASCQAKPSSWNPAAPCRSGAWHWATWGMESFED